MPISFNAQFPSQQAQIGPTNDFVASLHKAIQEAPECRGAVDLLKLIDGNVADSASLRDEYIRLLKDKPESVYSQIKALTMLVHKKKGITDLEDALSTFSSICFTGDSNWHFTSDTPGEKLLGTLARVLLELKNPVTAPATVLVHQLNIGNTPPSHTPTKQVFAPQDKKTAVPKTKGRAIFTFLGRALLVATVLTPLCLLFRKGGLKTFFWHMRQDWRVAFPRPKRIERYLTEEQPGTTYIRKTRIPESATVPLDFTFDKARDDAERASMAFEKAQLQRLACPEHGACLSTVHVTHINKKLGENAIDFKIDGNNYEFSFQDGSAELYFLEDGYVLEPVLYFYGAQTASQFWCAAKYMLGWGTGGIPAAMHLAAVVKDSLPDSHNMKPLVIAGGSFGGAKALAAGKQLKLKTYVWNPLAVGRSIAKTYNLLPDQATDAKLEEKSFIARYQGDRASDAIIPKLLRRLGITAPLPGRVYELPSHSHDDVGRYLTEPSPPEVISEPDFD